VPVIIYLQSLGLRKEAMVTALGLCFLVATLSLGSELARVGELAPSVLWLSLVALLPAWLGMEVGRRFRLRLDEAAFRRWFMVCVALMGGYLVLQSLA
jgi:uncharacterized membrane protein YfcA